MAWPVAFRYFCVFLVEQIKSGHDQIGDHIEWDACSSAESRGISAGGHGGDALTMLSVLSIRHHAGVSVELTPGAWPPLWCGP